MTRNGSSNVTSRHADARRPASRTLAVAVAGVLCHAADVAALDCAAIPDEEARRCCALSLPAQSMTQTLRITLADAQGTLREIAGDLAWKRLEDGREEGQVPEDALALTAGVDIGEHVIHYVIRAWSYYESSWLVEAGTVDRVGGDEWGVLAQILFMTKGKRRAETP